MRLNSIKTFTTLGISRASFEQLDADGDGKFSSNCGSQGNDVCGTIKLYLSNGNVISLAGALNWRETTGSVVEVLGFIFDAGQNAVINYGNNLTYNITGGITKNSSSTLGLKSYKSSFTFVDGENRKGNAATSGLLDALNSEFLNSPQPSVISLNPASVMEGANLVFNVTLSSTTTSEQVLVLRFSGTAVSGTDYNTTLRPLQFSNNVVNNNDGTISIPSGVSSFSITVPTVDDAVIESTKTLILTLGAKTVTGNILDNDAGFLGGAIDADQTLCAGASPSAFTSSILASGGTGTITYSWESRTDNTNFSLATGSTNSTTFTAGPLTQTTYFRRKAVDAASTVAYSNVVTVTVSPTSVAGSISGTSALCAFGTPTAISTSYLDGVSNATSGSNRGQTFTTGATPGSLNNIKLTIWPVGSPYLILREWVSDSDPSVAFTGAIIATSNVASDMPSTTNWETPSTFEFSTRPYLAPNTKYIFQVVDGAPYVKIPGAYVGGGSNRKFKPYSCQGHAVFN